MRIGRGASAVILWGWEELCVLYRCLGESFSSWVVCMLTSVVCDREENAEGSVEAYLNDWWPHLQRIKGAGDASLARDKTLVLPSNGFDIC